MSETHIARSLNPKAVRASILRCTRCDLSQRAGVTPVPFRGPLDAQVAIVGEAPGLQENIEGRPFVDTGASGRLLKDTLRDGGIDIEECYICNTVSCFPDGTPTVSEQRACRPNLRRQLRIVDPSWVLVLGAVALRHFDADLKISQAHGRWWLSGPKLIYPTFHPAAALRNPEWHERFATDVHHFCRLVLAG